MDVKFLESCCEAYIIKNNLYETHTTEQLFKDAYKTFYYMREYHNIDSLVVENYDKVNQQLFLNEYFDLTYKNDESITEVLDFATGALSVSLGVFGLRLLYKTFNSKITGILAPQFARVSKGLDKLGKWLSKGRYWKYKYAIIQKNLKQNYIKCDIDPNKVTREVYGAISDSDDKASAIEDKQAKCMRDTYLTLHIAKIALLLKSYFVCLRKTGNFDKVKNTDPKELMVIIASTNLSNACKDYHVIAKETLQDFDYMLDAFIKRNKQQAWYNKLMQSVAKAKKEIQNTKNLNKYK